MIPTGKYRASVVGFTASLCESKEKKTKYYLAKFKLIDEWDAGE